MNEDTNMLTIHLCNQRIAALNKYFTPATVVKIDGVDGTVADLIAAYQACLDARTQLASLQAQAKATQSRRDTADQKRAAIEEGVRSWVVTELGIASEGASDFGFSPKKKRAKLDGEALVKAKLQAQATRRARGTLGKRQKEKIHGVVPTVGGGAAPLAASPPASTGGVVTSGASTNGVVPAH